jgi:putative peptidoglycan binding protein
MKRSPLAVTGSVFVAALMGTGVAFAQAPETIHPDASGPKGGSQSERTGESDVPLPKGSPSSGTVEQGKSGAVNSGRSQSRDKAGQAINPDPNSSLGGSQSERTGETGVPLPEGSPHSGTVEKGAAGQSSMNNVKQAQQALKEKGYDPGPVDGVMGARTKEAIKSFQSASNLQATGTLDAETSQQLGIRSGKSSMSSRDDIRSSGNTTRGKDSDQPNLPPQSK